MDTRRRVSWLPSKKAQFEGLEGEDISDADVSEAFDEEGQNHLNDPIAFGENAGELTLINQILNHPEFVELARSIPGAKEQFENLATSLRYNEVAIDSPELVEAMHAIAGISPSMFREEQFGEFFQELSTTTEDDDVMIAQEVAISEANNPGEFERLMAEFKELYNSMTQQMIPARTPYGYAPTANRQVPWTRTAQAMPAMPPAGKVAPEMEIEQQVSPLEAKPYSSLEQLSNSLASMGPYEETYNRVLEQVDDEDQDSAKSALSAFFQGLPQGLSTLYEILVKAGIAEPVDQGIVEKIMEQHPQIVNDGQGKRGQVAGLWLPPADVGLYSTSGAMKKTASGYVGGPSSTHYTHGPGEQRFCPKLRNSVNTQVCRYHCLDGLPMDDHQILCGEAIWRQAIMDKYSREYRDADGNWVGGYINKRFEVERNTAEHPYQLKPNQRKAPINEDAWSPEKRLQELRRSESSSRNYSETPGDPKGLYSWDPYEYHGTTKNPQVFEKRKDPIAKIAWTKKEEKVAAPQDNVSWDDPNYVWKSDVPEDWKDQRAYEKDDKAKLNPFHTEKKRSYPTWTVHKSPSGNPAYRFDDYNTARAFADKKSMDEDGAKWYIMQQDDAASSPFHLHDVVNPPSIYESSSSWMPKKAQVAGKTCNACKKNLSPNALVCDNCGSKDLRTMTAEQEAARSGVTTKPVDDLSPWQNMASLTPGGIWKVTANGKSYYGETQKEAQEKSIVPEPLPLQEESEAVKKKIHERSLPEAPAPVALRRVEPSPQDVSRMVRKDHDPTPSTPARPMPATPAVEIQDGESEFSQGEISQEEIETAMAAEVQEKDKRDQEDFELYHQESKVIGPDPKKRDAEV